VEWDAAKFFVRGCTAVFLMYLLMKVNAKALPLQNPTSTKNHILVPILLVGIVTMFFETLIDQYVGPFEKTLRLYNIYSVYKRLLDAILVISGIIKVEVSAVSRAKGRG